MKKTLKNRNVVVLGLGMTGLSAARFAVRHGARVRVADTRSAPARAALLKRALPEVPLHCGPFDATTFDGADLLVVSPGLALSEPAIARAIASGIECVGDVELFARALPVSQKLLAITGSNGKSTVTSLVGHLLRAAGLRAVTVGNIGVPVLDALEDYEGAAPWPDAFVVELSSFQLETTTSLVATAAAVLNVSPNHLDRYADIDAYAAAKARIFVAGGEQILNRDDARSLAMRLPGRIVRTFGADIPHAEDDWGIVRRQDVPWLARGGSLLVPSGELSLVGRHNALNALAALALTESVAKIDRRVLAALSTFEGLAHRMERVATSGGIAFVNDSKATTVAATIAALAGFDRNVILIAGGDGKNQDFAALRPATDAHCRAVILLGRDAPSMAAALAGGAAIVELAPVLEIAVARAIALAAAGDVVLLSPACASLDMFRDFEDRGDRFKATVAAHTKEASHA